MKSTRWYFKAQLVQTVNGRKIMKIGSFLSLIPILAQLISLIRMLIYTVGRAAIRSQLSTPFRMLVGKDQDSNFPELIPVMQLNQLKEEKLFSIVTRIKCSLSEKSSDAFKRVLILLSKRDQLLNLISHKFSNNLKIHNNKH